MEVAVGDAHGDRPVTAGGFLLEGGGSGFAGWGFGHGGVLGEKGEACEEAKDEKQVFLHRKRLEGVV